MNRQNRAVILFSGGIDSTTTLAIAIESGYECYCLSFDYGQKHRIELQKAKQAAAQFEIGGHVFFPLDLTMFGGSALTSEIEVPKGRTIDSRIPVTYVPARNLIFLSLASAYGEVIGAYDIFYGANVLDYSGYPDCRPEFIDSLQQTINLGTKAGAEGKTFRIHAPLLKLSKSEIIKRGVGLGIDYAVTHSCYDPATDGRACGECDSCILRRKGFESAGVHDPTQYKS